MRPDIVSAAAALMLLAARNAVAHCPTHTCEFDPRRVCALDPVTGCLTGGPITRWASDCLSYAVQADGSVAQSISAETLRAVVDEGFAAWSRVACDGSGRLTPSVAAAYRGPTACSAVEFNCRAEHNDNIVMFRDGDSELGPATVALSSIVANLVSGEILDVDIELNSRDYPFSTDPAAIRGGAQDLRVVVNHELGHLLGLSHSLDASALMHGEYAGPSPLPSQDDARGICELLAVSDVEPECSAPPIAGAGSCVGVGGCLVLVPPQPAPECSFRAPEAPGAGGRAAGRAELGALLACLGLIALRRTRSEGRP